MYTKTDWRGRIEEAILYQSNLSWCHPACIEETEFEIMSCFLLTNLDSTSDKEVRPVQQLKEVKTTKKISAEPKREQLIFYCKVEYMKNSDLMLLSF